ncbi:MAG: lipoprotein insertase outer membrane protein LolB [Desulfuromonadaceae bacterium]|nr:lipoprotein insertase outer membrane protein LolB [Desulfuromonadaceae bacterium]MDD2856428.1 lipoprotein insertase outer membrane protein LolB [Desulfuromonadaceae bacterium]
MIKVLFVKKRRINFIAELLRISAFFMLLFTGCAAVKSDDIIDFSGTASIESLSSNASLVYSNSERSISGTGIFMFKKPDKLHLVLLSPFGSVLQEVFVTGDIITIIDSGNGNAFTGNYNDLPSEGNLTAWRQIHWIVDIDLPDTLRRTALINRTNRFGDREEAAFKNGLLKSKSTEMGGEVIYSNYAGVDGVAVPLEILYKTKSEEQFLIQFDDPEINKGMPDALFQANLSKYHLYPLSVLK